VFRKRPSEVVDAEAARQACNTASDAIEKTSVSNGSADNSAARTATKPPKTLPLPWGAPRIEPISVIVYAKLGANFRVGSGRRYSAAEDGSIAVSDPGDVEDLLRAGCQPALAS
jgi:hypothetical protein